MKKESLEILGAIPITDNQLERVLEGSATAEEVVKEQTTPQVIHKGVYTLWGLPDGGIRIQYKRSDKEEEDHMEVPGMVVRMAQAMSEGKLSPLAALRMMRNA